MEAEGLARVQAGAREAGLEIVERLDVIPIAGGKGRLFSVFTLRRIASARLVPQLEAAVLARCNVSQLVLRDSSGARTEAALELRRFFGLEGPSAEQPSPPRVRSGRLVARNLDALPDGQDA
jgi:hypothetical protein